MQYLEESPIRKNPYTFEQMVEKALKEEMVERRRELVIAQTIRMKEAAQ